MPVRMSDPSIPAVTVATDTMVLLVEDNGGPTRRIERGNFNKAQALPDVAALDNIESNAIMAREVQVVLDGTDGQPQIWIYDPASTATQSATVRVPSDGPASGRWVTRDHASGGSGGGTTAPTITAVNPNVGTPGQPGIVIIGTHLLGGTVEFTAMGGGRVQATVTNETETELTVSIPFAGATFGLIYVTTAGGEAQSPSAFNVIGGL